MTSAASRSPYDRSDFGNAELFQHYLNGTILYDHTRNSWFYWEDGRWHRDVRDYAFHRMGQVMRQRQALAHTYETREEQNAEWRWSINSQKSAFIQSALRAAASKPSMQTPDWDTDPWIIGVGNGLVDLSSGRFRKQKQSDPVFLKSAVEYDEGAKCPRWERYLTEVFGSQDEIEFVQRAVGYTLTGFTNEQCFFYLIGGGSNGKSTFQEVISKLLGEYHIAAAFNMFTTRRGDIPNDIAAVQGKRLVTTGEPNQRAVWDEQILKAMTGGDTISARWMRGEFFQFRPACKLWVAANIEVRSRDLTDAFWRRVRMIDFPNRFSPGDEPDLEAKLGKELPGILNWALEGCLAWKKVRLSPPDTVVERGNAYRDSERENVFGGVSQFRHDRLFPDPKARLRASAIYDEYLRWSKKHLTQREILSSVELGRQLVALGATRGHDEKGSWYAYGILPPQISTEAPDAG